MTEPTTAVQPPPESPPRVDRRRLTWGLIVFLGAGIIVAGLARFTSHHTPGKTVGTEEADQGDEVAGAVRVEVVRPKAGGLSRSTTQAGSVHAFEYAELYAKVSGYLTNQTVDIGDTVRRGQLLAEIDDPEVHKAVDQAKAALDQAKAKVQVAEAMVHTAEAMRDAAKATVSQSVAEVKTSEYTRDYREKAYARIGGLVQLGATEKKLLDEQKDQLDSSASAVEVSKAAVLSARAQLMAKGAMIRQAQADLAEAHAKVEVAEADLGRAKVVADYTRIISPYDGVVTRRAFHRGDFVRSAAEGTVVSILSVARVDKMRVVFPIPDREVRFLDKGDAATVVVNALPGREFRGVVARSALSEDPASRNMRTEVDLENPDGLLQEGMYGDVTILLQQAAPGSLTIPSACLVTQTGGGAGTVNVVQGGKSRVRAVRVGIDNGTTVEVISGLKPGDQVVFRAGGAIGDGTDVRVDKADEATH